MTEQLGGYEVLLSQIVDGLKKNARYSLELDDLRAAEIMKAVMEKALEEAKKAGVQASVLTSKVAIANGKGSVSGRVFVDHSLLKDNIDINCVLGNVGRGNLVTLGLDELKIKANTIPGKLALGALGIEKQVRQVLENPVKALTDALSPELKTRGVELGGLGAKFTDKNTLMVVLARK